MSPIYPPFIKKQKIFAQTGRQQVGLLTSADRGILCMSLYGHCIPPALIFPATPGKISSLTTLL
jgi:hypothetical protein